MDNDAHEQRKDIAQYIDHTILKPDATMAQVDILCDEAVTHGFASVCVNSTWTAHCSRRLAGSSVKVCTVVGFPLGAMSGEAKAAETALAVKDGAQEIDMVIQVGRLKAGEHDEVERDIRLVRAACPDAILKVIIETCLLTEEEKVMACVLARKAQADFVKTSTGFSHGGATVDDIRLMRTTVGPDMGVKASGGIRSAEDAAAMIEAGATRLGTSSGVKIVQGLVSREAY